MKKFAMLCILLLLFIGLSGCYTVSPGISINAVQGSGDMVSRDFDIAEFNVLNVLGGYVVIYRQSQTPAVTIQMQENLFDYINVASEDGILRISSDRTFRTDRGYTPRIYVYAPYLSNVIISGSALLEDWETIYTDSLSIHVSGAASGSVYMEVEELRIDMFGSANFDLVGTADTARINVSGTGDVDASELQTRSAHVNVAGVGNVEIAVSDTLDATISGVGNVWYIGSPQVNRTITGLGRVQRR